MMLAPFDDAYVARNAAAAAYALGDALQARRAVQDAVGRGEDVYAAVWEDEEDACYVRIRPSGSLLEPVASTVCTCAYAEAGWCPHVVAVLLHVRRSPDALPSEPPLTATLDALDAGRLRAILLSLADDDPGLVEQITWLADPS